MISSTEGLAIAEEARTQVRVARFLHQGRRWNHELDCIGLVVLTMKRLGYAVQDQTDYGRNPNPKHFLRSILQYCEEISTEEMRPGDFLLCVTNTRSRYAHHVGIIGPPLSGGGSLTLIHTHFESNFVQQVPYVEPWIGLTRGACRWRQSLS